MTVLENSTRMQTLNLRRHSIVYTRLKVPRLLSFRYGSALNLRLTNSPGVAEVTGSALLALLSHVAGLAVADRRSAYVHDAAVSKTDVAKTTHLKGILANGIHMVRRTSFKKTYYAVNIYYFKFNLGYYLDGYNKRITVTYNRSNIGD